MLFGVLIQAFRSPVKVAARELPNVDAAEAFASPTQTPAIQKPVEMPVPTTSLQPIVATQAQAAAVEAIYVVKPGDTLSKVAKLHGTTVQAIKEANELTTDRIAIGAKLKMPPKTRF